MRYLGRNSLKKPWVTRAVLDLCDESRDLKKRLCKEEGAKEYRTASKRVQKVLKKAKEDLIDTQCKEIDACLNKNNSKKAYQLVKDLTAEKQGRSTTIKDKSEKFSADKQSISQSEKTMRLMVTIQFWTAVSTQEKIYSQSFMRKLRSQ